MADVLFRPVPLICVRCLWLWNDVLWPASRSVRNGSHVHVTTADILVMLPIVRKYQVSERLPACARTRSHVNRTRGHACAHCGVHRAFPPPPCPQGMDDLGRNFFKLECYFVTHFLYVVSEWGKCCLQADLFWEEVQFIARNMKVVRGVQLPVPFLGGGGGLAASPACGGNASLSAVARSVFLIVCVRGFVRQSRWMTPK